MHERKHKKAVFWVVFAALCLLALSGRKSAHAAEEDFVIEDGVLVSYTGTDTEIVIPDGVKEIGKHAFSRNDRITEVILPEQVKVIGEEAFFYCTNLMKINLEHVERIEYYAFGYCSQLKKVVLAEKMEYIGGGI